MLRLMMPLLSAETHLKSAPLLCLQLVGSSFVTLQVCSCTSAGSLDSVCSSQCAGNLEFVALQFWRSVVGHLL